MAPELLSLAIALWVGICLYLSLIDGTHASYVFMLAGYTVALLGFLSSRCRSRLSISCRPRAGNHTRIICASVVAMVVLPRSVASAVTTQRMLARRCTPLGMNVLAGNGSDRIVTTNASDLQRGFRNRQQLAASRL